MRTSLTIILCFLCISCLKSSPTPNRSDTNIWLKNGYVVNVSKEVIEKRDLFIFTLFRRQHHFGFNPNRISAETGKRNEGDFSIFYY